MHLHGPQTKSEAWTKERFTAANPQAQIFWRQHHGGAVFLALAPGRLMLVLDGPIASDQFVAMLRDAKPGDILGSDVFHALIDLRSFSGVVDWKDISEIRNVMPKGGSRTNRNAYLVRNQYLAMAATITAAFFSQTECKAFLKEEDARAWLGWAETPAVPN